MFLAILPSVQGLNITYFNTTYFWSYQENASEVGCSGTWESGTNCTNVTDNDWGTYGMVKDLGPTTPNQALVYINYSKPSTSTPNSLWQIKYGSIASPTLVNISLPPNCWNQIPLQLMLNSTDKTTQYSSQGYCFDGGSWLNISERRESRAIFEEGIHWYKTNESGNITLTSGTQKTIYIPIKRNEFIVNATINIISYNKTDFYSETPFVDLTIDGTLPDTNTNYNKTLLLSYYSYELFRNNITSIPYNAKIINANFSMYLSGGLLLGAGELLNISEVVGYWNESWTWNSGIPTYQEKTDSILIDAGPTWEEADYKRYFFNVTLGLQNKVNQKNETASWLIYNKYAISDAYEFVSRENGTNTFIPFLNATYVWSFAENLSLDFGSDAIIEYINSSNLDNILLVNLNASAFNSYLASCNYAADGFCYVPLSILSNTSSIFGYSDIQVLTMPKHKAEYISDVFELTNTTYTLSVNVSEGENVSAKLYLNGSLIETSKKVDGNTTTFNRSALLPSITDSSSYNWSFFWSFEVNYSTGEQESYKTFNYTQTIHRFLIDNCTLSPNTTLTINFFDELSPTTPIIVEGSIIIDYWISADKKYVKNYSGSLDNKSSLSYCANIINNETYEADIYVIHNASAGLTNRFYLFNQSLSKDPLNLTLFNLVSSTGISQLTITTRDKLTYGEYPNIHTQLQRFYPSENVWKTVQEDLSTQYGQNFFNIEEKTTDYKLSFLDTANNILDQSNNLKFSCTSGLCQYDYLILPYQSLTSITTPQTLIVCDNQTKTVSTYWTDPLGRNLAVTSKTTRQSDAATATTMCEETKSGATGQIDCNTSIYVGNFYTEATVEVNGQPYFVSSKWCTFTQAGLRLVTGEMEGAFWTAALCITMIGFGVVFGGVGAIIGLMIALITSTFLGLTSVLTMGFLVLTGIMSIMIGVKIRR